MRTPTLCLVTSVMVVLFSPTWVSGQSHADEAPQTTELRPRVRSEDAAITSLIARASAASTTFRDLLDRIDRTDGLVYVNNGQCLGGMRACLLMRMILAGPTRMLRIVIDPSRADCDVDLMSTIGHELWHTIEVLQQPSLRSTAGMASFYAREGRPMGWSGGWETTAAVKAGLKVRAELRKAIPKNQRICGQ